MTAAFYIAADLDQALGHPRLILDVAPGQPEGFSLGAGPRHCFITQTAMAATAAEEAGGTRGSST